MTVDDVDRVAAIEADVFPDAWSRTMVEEEVQAPGRHYVVAEDGSEIIGYAGVWIGLDDAQVMTIAVTADARGRGLGRELLADLIEHSRAQRMERVLLEVRVDNAVARNLYESMGFSIVGYRRKYYSPDGMDAAVMVLGLGDVADGPATG